MYIIKYNPNANKPCTTTYSFDNGCCTFSNVERDVEKNEDGGEVVWPKGDM